MQIDNFAVEYQAKTDEELLRLATSRNQLTSAAQDHLTRELAKRGISEEEVRIFGEEQLRKTEKAGKSEFIASSSRWQEKGPHTIAHPLPFETKAPWRPKVAGRIAFFFGPVAGAMIVAISLRRMDQKEAAKRALLLAVGMAAAEAAIIFFVPDVLARLVGLGAEIVFLLIFPVLMENQFNEWQAAHPDVTPYSGWRSIGWGFVGSAVFLIISVFVFVGLATLLPAHQ